MVITNINATESGNMTNTVKDFEVAAQNTEGVSDQKETEYLNSNFTKWYGYFKTISELNAAIKAKATWTVGKGIKAGNMETVILDKITGTGVDTFDSILKNMVIISHVNGDAYAEIVRNDKGTLINLKPLDPSSITVVFSRQGIITKYKQRNKTGSDTGEKTFTPDKIFHLVKDRVADELGGASIIESVQWVIDAINETMADQRVLMHRNVVPKIVWKLDTDNETKIQAFKRKAETATANAEHLYIPKGAADFEVLAVPPNSSLNPMPWIEYLNGFFWKAVRIPQIIVGGSQEFTEATAKIAYLAFQQEVEEAQRDIEEQVWEQLALRIELNFPASLENELLSDEKKDKETGATQPSDTTVGLEQE